MTDITNLSAAALADRLAAGEISSVEATQAHLDRIAAVDGDIHAFLHVSDHALDVAADIDRRRASGEVLNALAGVPVAIKDVLVTTDMPWQGELNQNMQWLNCVVNPQVVAVGKEAQCTFLTLRNTSWAAMPL